MMRRRPTVEIPVSARANATLCWLGLSVAVVLGSLCGGEAFAQGDAAQQQFVFAHALLQRNEDKLAAGAFDDFLSKFPNDPRKGDAVYYRAFLARRMDNPKAAAAMLDAAGVPAPTLVPEYRVQLLRGQLAIDLNDYDRAVASLEKIKLEPLDPTMKASTLYLTGLAYRGAGNLPAALKTLQDAGAIESTVRGQAMLETARVQVQLNKSADAMLTLEKTLALKDPAVSAEASVLAGELAFQSGDFPKAIEHYTAVVTGHQSSPHFGAAIMGLLWSRFSAQQYDAVLQAAEQYKNNLQPQQALVARYLAASAQQELGQHDKAAESFKALLAAGASANDFELRDKATYKLALSQYELGKTDEMQQTLANFATSFPKSQLLADVQFLLAAADAKRGDATAGAARLTSIIDAGPTSPAYARAVLQRGRIYETGNNLQAAVEDYARYLDAAARLNPLPSDIPAILLRLTDLSFRLEKFTDADKYAAQLLTGNVTTPGGATLSLGKVDPIVEQEAMYRRALALVKLGKPDAALAQLTDLLTKHPQNKFLAQARYYRGLLLVLQQKADEGLADLQAAAGANDLPENLKANALRLAGVRLREKKDAEPVAAAALLALEKLIGLNNLKPDELVWLGRYDLAQKQPKEALRHLKPLLDEKSTAPGVARAHAFLLTGKAMQALNEAEPAATAFGEVIKLNQGFEQQARLELARTLAAQNKIPEALVEYDRLMNAVISDVSAAANSEAGALHRQLAQKHRLSGNNGEMTKELEKAEESLLRVVLLTPFPELSPIPELAYLDLAEVQNEMGNSAKAVKTLQGLADNFPNGPYASYAKAVIALSQHEKAQAEFLLKKLREQQLEARLAEKLNRTLKTMETSP